MTDGETQNVERQSVTPKQEVKDRNTKGVKDISQGLSSFNRERQDNCMLYCMYVTLFLSHITDLVRETTVRRIR